MALALVAVLLVAPAAGLRLDWQAPAACPDGEEVRARVLALVGAEAAGQARLAATAVVRAQGERWALDLELVRDAGRDRRTVVDADCGALAEAAALVIAVAIDPRARPRAEVSLVPPPPPGGGPEEAVPGDRSPGGVEEAVPRDRSPAGIGAVPGDRSGAPGGVKGAVLGDRYGVADGSEGAVPGDRSAAREDGATVAGGRPSAGGGRGPQRRLQVGLRLGAGVGFTRLLPGPHAALDLGLGLEGRGWRVELAGGFVPPVRGVATSDAAIGGRFRLATGELRGCGVPALRRAPLAFPLCAGLQLGAMHGRGEGRGLAVAEEARALWVATRLGAALRWRPRGGRVGLWFGVDAIVALTRPAFVTAGGVLVHQAARAGGQVGVGVEVRLR